MRKLLAILVFTTLVAACGGSDNDPAPQAAKATPAEVEHADEGAPHDMSGYSEGVKKFYGTPHTHEGEGGDVEAEYHQPPIPPGTGVGGEITLTGTEIGVRMITTVTKVEPQDDFVAVHIDAVSTGIAMFPGPFQGELTFSDGTVVPNDPAGQADCAKTLEGLWVGEGEHAKGCLLFPVDGDENPEQVQISLQAVPAEAGGIWKID